MVNEMEKMLSSVIEELRNAEVGVIVLPILFSEKDRLGGDEKFAETLNGNFVVVGQVGSHQTTQNGYPRGVAKDYFCRPFRLFILEILSPQLPIPEIGNNAAGVGVLNTSPEIDGVVRRMPLLMKIGNDVYPAMAIEVIRTVTGDPSYQVKSDAVVKATEGVDESSFATIKTDANFVPEYG